jgi:hypothetical protein
MYLGSENMYLSRWKMYVRGQTEKIPEKVEVVPGQTEYVTEQVEDVPGQSDRKCTVPEQVEDVPGYLIRLTRYLGR